MFTHTTPTNFRGAAVFLAVFLALSVTTLFAAGCSDTSRNEDYETVESGMEPDARVVEHMAGSDRETRLGLDKSGRAGDTQPPLSSAAQSTAPAAQPQAAAPVPQDRALAPQAPKTGGGDGAAGDSSANRVAPADVAVEGQEAAAEDSESKSIAPALGLAPAPEQELPALRGSSLPAEGRRPGSGNVPAPERRPFVPEPPPADMYYQDYGVNPWVDTVDDRLSTFAMDVDTGSYTLARGYILDGSMPPIESVRVEEFVNYFEQDYAPPRRSDFAVHLDGARSPWGDENESYLRVGIQGREVTETRRQDAVLTFVIDVSGSMDQGGRLELVKDSLLELADQMGSGDRIGIVAYSDDAWVVLPTTDARDRRQIERAISRLYPTNSTNAEAGLELGYELAEEAYRSGATNRVILCSDGVANVGATGPAKILRRIHPAVEKGITLTAVGVGMGNYNDVLLEQLADNGDGSYYYVDDLQEARRVFVENLTGTLEVIARDAKVQVEFDPDRVAAYRLIGYENRDVADRDFRDDTVDAGEIGAGHSVTALYALIVHPGARGRLATARIRYLDPEERDPQEISESISTSSLESSFGSASPRFRVTVAAATFAEILRDGYYTRSLSLNNVIRVAQDAADDLEYDQEVDELVDLMQMADGRGIAYDYEDRYSNDPYP